MSINKRMKELREANGLNKAEFAKIIGVTKSSITRYENDEMKPNLDVIQNICSKFGVTMEWLANGKESDKPDEYAAVFARCRAEGISPKKLNSIIDILIK